MFKKGDKIKRVIQHNILSIGSNYIVERVEANGLIRLRNIIGEFNPENFELVEPNTPIQDDEHKPIVYSIEDKLKQAQYVNELYKIVKSVKENSDITELWKAEMNKLLSM